MAEIKKIIVLYGGASSEREVSINSGEGIYKALLDLGYSVNLKDFNDVDKLEYLKEFDLVFIALHGFEGESGDLQKSLDSLGILYTGSNYLACKNTWNKTNFKNILKSVSISTPRGFSVENIHFDMPSPFDIFNTKHDSDIKKLFLKPEEDGSSIDIFEINSDTDLVNSIRNAQIPNRAFIFEESIKHREYTVSIINGKCLPIIEIKTSNSFYDYDAKYISDNTQLLEVELDQSTKEEINNLSLQAFNKLGCSNWGRVDILEDAIGNFYVLEINTVPGMTSHSCVPRSAELAGISYKELVQLIIKDVQI